MAHSKYVKQATIFEEPDIVIILDACRYDKFIEVKNKMWFDGDTIPVWSPAHQTADWYKYYWGGRQDKNRILISATPVPWRPHWVGDLIKNFYRTVPVWDNPEQCDELDNPIVDLVMHEANKMKTVNPTKKLLIHMMPPHLPFYGKKGFKWCIDNFGGKGKNRLNFYEQVKGQDWRKIREYYNESIEKALKEVFEHKWIQDYHTVITADHGEIVGEGNGYGHSQFPRETPLLRIVPWHTVSEGKQ